MVNIDADVEGAAAATDSPVDKAAAKAAREAERMAQKARSAAPKKIRKVEEAIAQLEAQLEALDAELFEAGSDVSKATELSVQRQATQGKVDKLYEEWEELDALLLAEV